MPLCVSFAVQIAPVLSFRYYMAPLNHPPITTEILSKSCGEGTERLIWPPRNINNRDPFNIRYGAFDLAGYEKGAAWWYRAWWLDNIPLSESDRSIPTATPHVCQIWGDRWDDSIAKHVNENGAGHGDSNRSNHDGHGHGDETHKAEGGGAQASVTVVTAAATVDLLLDGTLVGTQSVMALENAGFSKVPFTNGSNLTAVCRDATQKVVGSHTLVGPGAPTALRLSLDAPSVTKGTGSALLLDGKDVALLKAEIVDAKGYFVGKNISLNVTFSVTAG